MNRSRRRFLQWTASAALLPAASNRAWAQAYPSRPVRFIVGFPAGNAPDIIARLVGQMLTERLGQQFVIENRPGAASNIATEAALSAPADGYTLLMIVLSNVFNAQLYSNLKFNFMHDIAPVGGIANAPYLIVVNPSVPARTMPEFISYAKAHPGKINYASGGNGSSSHIFGELLKKTAGIDLVHVPYRGSFMPDLLAGQVQMTINPIPQAMEYVRTERLRAIAATTAKRLDFLPDIPTVSESVPGYVATGWYGLCMPKNTPAEIVTTINEALNAALADPKIKARLATLGVEPMPMTPVGLQKFIADEHEKWSNVIKSTGIKAG
jgi:tripartite-type tricarboxylate transporter receptor subunit TctC